MSHRFTLYRAWSVLDATLPFDRNAMANRVPVEWVVAWRANPIREHEAELLCRDYMYLRRSDRLRVLAWCQELFTKQELLTFMAAHRTHGIKSFVMVEPLLFPTTYFRSSRGLMRPRHTPAYYVEGTLDDLIQPTGFSRRLCWVRSFDDVVLEAKGFHVHGLFNATGCAIRPWLGSHGVYHAYKETFAGCWVNPIEEQLGEPNLPDTWCTLPFEKAGLTFAQALERWCGIDEHEGEGEAKVDHPATHKSKQSGRTI